MNAGRDRRRWSIRLPKDVPAVRTARSALDRWLNATGVETADAADSIVTELVANAVALGRPPIEHARRPPLGPLLKPALIVEASPRESRSTARSFRGICGWRRCER